MKGVVIHYSRRAQIARHPALQPPRTRLEDTVLDLAAAETTAARAIGWILTASTGTCTGWSDRMACPGRVVSAAPESEVLRSTKTFVTRSTG